MRSQLDAEKKRVEEIWEELSDTEKALTEVQAENSDLKQKSAPAEKNLPDAADVLNQLKTRRKKSKADLTDLELILEIWKDFDF